MDMSAKTRYLCSELIKLEWQTKAGSFDTIAILEEIWTEGARVQTMAFLQPGTKVSVVARKALLRGTLTDCDFQGDGYFSRIIFHENSQWTRQNFKPEHLLNTRTVIAQWLKKNLAEAEAPMVQAAGRQGIRFD